jgi:hypothetical protein
MTLGKAVHLRPQLHDLLIIVLLNATEIFTENLLYHFLDGGMESRIGWVTTEYDRTELPDRGGHAGVDRVFLFLWRLILVAFPGFQLKISILQICFDFIFGKFKFCIF